MRVVAATTIISAAALATVAVTGSVAWSVIEVGLLLAIFGLLEYRHARSGARCCK